ncbi:MAG: protein kinase [Oscillospiraceae bacterium]|nr:protein kinase [Oscillospiraceae bacterium]
MLDHQVSPLLDAMEVGECFARHDGASCYRILHPESGREFVLKHISVPAGRDRVDALLLTGAYTSEEEADAYYRKEAEALVQEAEVRKKLLDCPYILPFLGVQMEKKEGVGYDVYAVLPKRNSLERYLNENAVSHLRGINMGIDLCVALAALWEEGYVHGNLKPGNVFFSDTGRFLLGDFGLISTQDMQYAVLPEQYKSPYSAPELAGILGGLNPTVDLYSLGMILYRIYNGNHAPFEDEQTSPKAADAKRTAGEELPAPLYADYELAAIIRKACAFDPKDRYQTPDEMRLELEAYMRRNAVSDHLIVPPLVTDGELLDPEAAEAEPEPVRFADPEQLDENFKKTFQPEEKKDKKKPQEETPPQPEEPPQVAADRRRQAEEQQKKKAQRRKRAWILFAALMALLVAAIGLYEFTDLGQGLWHYFVTVEELQVSDITDDSLKLNLRTNTNPDDFTALCQDAYGNSYPGSFRDGSASFTGLTPGTQYNLKIELPGAHRVSGPTSVTAVTMDRVEVLTFTAVQGTEEGAVQLNLVVKDEAAEPEKWSLAYGKAGQEPASMDFSGHSVQVRGLETGSAYTFTLTERQDLYLTGQTQTSFTPLPPIQASELALEAIQNGEATVSWRCAGTLPESWTLSCSAADETELPVELMEPKEDENSWICAAKITGLAPDVTYSLKLTAPGLYQPLTMELVDDAIRVSDLTAQAEAEGLRVSWTPSRDPAQGWILEADCGADAPRSLPVTGNSVLLTTLPELDYTLTLRTADGSRCEGSLSITARSQENRRFTRLGLSNGISIGTYDTPSKENWSFEDLGGGTVRYHQNDPVTFVITVSDGMPESSEEQMIVQYVIREAGTDRVVHYDTEARSWNSLWNGARWMGQIPWKPATPGEYTFSIYLNGQRLGTIGFTLLG